MEHKQIYLKEATYDVAIEKEKMWKPEGIYYWNYTVWIPEKMMGILNRLHEKSINKFKFTMITLGDQAINHIVWEENVVGSENIWSIHAETCDHRATFVIEKMW